MGEWNKIFEKISVVTQNWKAKSNKNSWKIE
jgi:hypothetical protein